MLTSPDERLGALGYGTFALEVPRGVPMLTVLVRGGGVCADYREDGCAFRGLLSVHG